MEKHVDGKIESSVETWQGFMDRPVLAVLTVSTILAVGVLAVLWSTVI
ncbi:MAG: hypothetical protein J0H17_19195 [Rhizobiales bacterium]|jgi:hypothetical protein|nr:hypothetical protein [Hyphomicrobiales bacterium]